MVSDFKLLRSCLFSRLLFDRYRRVTISLKYINKSVYILCIYMKMYMYIHCIYYIVLFQYICYILVLVLVPEGLLNIVQFWNNTIIHKV